MNTRHRRSSSAALVTLALLLGAPRSRAANTTPVPAHPFTLEHALVMNSFSDLVWSADGRRLAFVVTSVDTAENTTNADVWLWSDGEARRLTRHPKADNSPTFSPGGDTLAFIANRGSGDDARSSIYMMSLRGGEPWAFGTYDEAVTEVGWSPDGKYLAYVMIDTLSKRMKEWRKKKWDQVVEGERWQYPRLWVVELSTGKKRRLTSGDTYVWNVRWSPDSRAIAFLVSPTGWVDDGNLVDIGIVSASGGAMRKVGAIGAPFAWSPDGKWIAWASGSDRTQYVEKSDLWVAPAGGGRPVDLTAGFDEDADTPSWSAQSDTLLFHSAQGASSVLAAVPRAGGAVTLSVDRGGQASSMVAARERVAWVQSTPTSPVEVWSADHPRLAGAPVTSLHAAMTRLDLGVTRTFSWRSTDGVRVEAVLLRPHGAPARAPLKTLMWLHGGPYTSRATLGFQAVPQYLAAHGYQVFMPNFRSSGGYGTAFMMRQRSDWGGQDWRDVSSGIDSLIRAGLADSTRLGIYGHSYGGYLTAWAITQTRRFDAAGVLAGAVDLAGLYGQSDTHRYRAWEFDGAPWETPENWKRMSPMTYVTRVKTPSLIEIGDNDARIPYPQGQQLYRALLMLGVPTEFVHYPREGHTVREPRHKAFGMMALLAWFDRWVR
jgi:dipeptidyl aminopeptidase/acylaminoacyl peptidase